MGKPWPVDRFREHLRALMDAEGIPDYAELSRITGVSQNQFSNWRRGLSQPSQESLRKVATGLGMTSARTLFQAAGLYEAAEMEADDSADEMVSLPREFRDLIDLWKAQDPEGRAVLRRSAAILVAGFLAEQSQRRPSGRRRTA